MCNSNELKVNIEEKKKIVQNILNLLQAVDPYLQDFMGSSRFRGVGTRYRLGIAKHPPPFDI
jgi:hypothetical protein